MVRPKAGMKWRSHFVDGIEYNLIHLHPCEKEFVISGIANEPELRLRLLISYSIHCFTRNPDDGEVVVPDAWYSDNHERRVFCPWRWKLSHRLPDIIATLDERKCLHTDRECFVTIEVIEGGKPFEYAVFFTVSRGRKSKADLNLFVNSAHERANGLRYKKPIRFKIILRNIYRGKSIKSPG